MLKFILYIIVSSWAAAIVGNIARAIGASDYTQGLCAGVTIVFVYILFSKSIKKIEEN